MSLLLEIQKQIELAQGRVRKLEESLCAYPDLPSVAANLDSAVRIEQRLKAQFQEQAAIAGFDICTYRAFDDHESPIAGPALGAIAKFQSLVSVVYSALKHGPKQRAVVSEQDEKDSAFGFGYAFTGSVGVVLTVRNERMLLGETILDESVDTIFSLAESTTAAEVLAIAEKIGAGPVNALYEWAVDNSKHGLGAEVEWRRGGTVKRRVLVQHQQLTKLRNAIDSMSSEKQETVVTIGILTAADVSKNRFKLSREGLREIKGTIATTIDDKHRVSLPKLYEATITKTVRFSYSTGKSEQRFHLIRLKEPPKEGRKSGPKKK